MISHIVNWIFEVIWLLIIIVIFLSWVPNIDWSHPALRFLRNFTELFLEPFRRIIPSVNGLDFSPIIAILFLQIVASVIVKTLQNFGL